MYQVYRQTMGNKPLLFGGGSPDTGVSEDLTGVEFINGTRPGNPQLVELAKSQVGNVGGQPYWSWYGFDSRVEWCACFVSWCYGQFVGLVECCWFFQFEGEGERYKPLAFFLGGSTCGGGCWDVYTVEGNSGDACKIKSYDLNYQSIKGYGLMNW